MKVAIIPFEFPVISETFVINIATGLLDRGHEIGIYPLSGRRNNTSIQQPNVKKYELLFKTKYPPEIALGGQIFNVPKFFRFLTYSGHSKYDIIHFQFGQAALQCLPFKNLKFFHGKWVVSFRGYDISSFLRVHGQNVYNQLFKDADMFLSNSDFFKDRLISLGCEPSKAYIYRSGIDCRKFAFSPKKLSMSQTVKLITVGRLVEKKGVEFAIQAAVQLCREKIDIEFLIIGDGPLKEHLQNLIEGFGCIDQIKLAGSRDQDFIISALQNSHIFISSGTTAQDGDQNGPDNTIKEAMAMGLPVIASRTGAIEEVVQDGITGLLVKERDIEELVLKIKYLIKNQDQWPVLTQSARKFIEQKYNLNTLTDELIDRYRQIIK